MHLRLLPILFSCLFPFSLGFHVPRQYPTVSEPSETHSSEDSGATLTLSEYEHHILVHAVLVVIGFLVFLPSGILVGRYLRSFTPIWVIGHWSSQLIAAPFIIAGFSFGVRLVNEASAVHFDDGHKRRGLALLILYFVQCLLGFVVFKFKPWFSTRRRPIQNYVHVVLGLVIIILALYQARTGYTTEWHKATEKKPLPKVTNAFWFGLVVSLPLFYLLGLALLPRQLKREKEDRDRTDPIHNITKPVADKDARKDT